MWPYSYTGLKIVHDQNIAEALERYRFAEGQGTRKQGLLQMAAKLGTTLTSFRVKQKKSARTGEIG